MRSSVLFEPFEIGRLRLRNRLVMAPMTREKAPGGVPTQEMLDYYARRARGGVGLIITEGIAPAPEGSFGSAVPRLYGEDAVEGWRRIVDAVHGEGAAIFAQLWHVGAFSPGLIGMAESLPGVPRLSPSGLAAPGRSLGRAMAEADIDRTIEQFSAAAANARRAGFDGIELHGAHGYLLDQFLWEGTNRRSDRYGGDLERRTAFAVELVRRVKAATGPDFPIAFRLSQWKQLDYGARIAATPAELGSIVEPLGDAGVDLFHCSTRRFWEAAFPEDPRNLAAWVKALSGKPVITVGSVTLDTDFKAPTGKIHADPATAHIDLLERGIEEGQFDLVAIGRALIANPDWPRLVAEDCTDRLRAFEKKMLDELH